MKREEPKSFAGFPDILTVKEVGQALQIGRIGVYKLLSEGTLKGFKIGNTYKIPKAALIEYVDKQCGLIRESDKNDRQFTGEK